MMKIFGTHSGAFHADDVFAIAALSMLHPEYEIHRSRDPKVWAKCDYLVDVGGYYNHDEKVYDHHFKNGPTYDDGLKMSSIGLIWSHYGTEICGCPDIADRISRRLIRQFDAIDNGVTLTHHIEDFSDVREISLSGSISMMNPQDHSKTDDVFEGEVVRARLMLQTAIAQAKHWIDSREGVELALNVAHNEKRSYIIVPEDCKWIEHLFNSNGNETILYAIFPNGEKWYARTVPSAPGEFSNRKDFPTSWAGLSDEAFSKVAQIPDGVFCHHGLFICATGSLQSTMKLVADAIKA
ncbi:MYG1 family protein [Shewanella psychromarinicola]|uniref:MYG1 family protein n=2 Tax=Shewanella psychromarinicola TaxID=2487742 RepID=A0ABM7C2L3_9GAMM|nr:MYG1 family protein [Shewanella psychromarinicola]